VLVKPDVMREAAVTRNLGLLLAVILLAALAMPTHVGLASGTAVEVNSGDMITLAPGGSQSDIPLTVSGIPDLGPDNGVGGFTFELSWDKDVIHVDTVDAATISGFSIFAGIPDNTTGTVTIAGYTTGNYLSGDVTLATLGISAVGNVGDSTSIEVTITDLGDKNANPIPATPVNAPLQASGTVLTYVLTMTINGSGSTTPAVGNHAYPAGRVVNISATPDADWQFVNWTGDIADPSSATTTVTLDAHKTVAANFTFVAEKDSLPSPTSEQRSKSADTDSNASDEAVLPPMPPQSPPPAGMRINLLIFGGIVAGVIVVGLLIFVMVKRRAY
jgi:hypothetical protein